VARPVVHWEIAAGDSERLRRFYGDVFGWDVEPDGEYRYVETGGEVGINGGLRQIREEEAPYLTVYVQVPDVIEALDRATASGGRVLMPPADAGEGSVALFSDPEGNVIGLLSTSGASA
jgi:uncharacterized protein